MCHEACHAAFLWGREMTPAFFVNSVLGFVMADYGRDDMLTRQPK